MKPACMLHACCMHKLARMNRYAWTCNCYPKSPFWPCLTFADISIRKYLCQYYISERLFRKKKGYASTNFCRSYVRKPSQWHAWPEQKFVMGLEKEEPSSSPIIKKGRGDSGKVIWWDTGHNTDSSSTDEHTDFVMYVILLRKWFFQKYQYINPISFWVPGT